MGAPKTDAASLLVVRSFRFPPRRIPPEASTGLDFVLVSWMVLLGFRLEALTINAYHKSQAAQRVC